MQADGTMGVEAIFRHFLCRWPWLLDLGLAAAATAIFCPPASAAAPADLPQVQPWMYVNLIMESTQAVVPLSRDVLKVGATLSAMHERYGDMAPGQALFAQGSKKPAAARARTGGDGGGKRGLMQLHTIARYVKSTAEAADAVSAAVVERPAVFQLMCQARSWLSCPIEHLPWHR